MKQPPENPISDRQHQNQMVTELVTGDESASERLYYLLEPRVRNAVGQFFSPGQPDADDVVQETFMAFFDYLRKQGGFEGDLILFAVTIARNRCRNIVSQRKRNGEVPLEPLAQWIADRRRSPLDILMDTEIKGILQRALNAIGRICRLILRGFYMEGRSMADLREATGLKSLQGVYYRRSVCLKQMEQMLEDALHDPE